MHRLLITLFSLLGITMLGRASTFAMLSNQHTSLVPLRYYCTITGSTFIMSNSNYVVRDGKHEIAFRLFDQILKVDGQYVIVPTPPIILRGITFIPLRVFAETRGDTIELIENSNYYNEYKAADEKGEAYPSRKLIAVHHEQQLYSLPVHGLIQYLNTSNIAVDSCAFSVYSTLGDASADENDYQFFPLPEDMFITQYGKILWSGNGATSGDIVAPPKIIKLHNGVKLIAFTSFMTAASLWGLDYYLLHFTQNHIEGTIPRHSDSIYLNVTASVGDAGVLLSTTSKYSKLITYEIISLNDENESIRYCITWYKWKNAEWTRVRQQLTNRVTYDRGHQEQQLQQIFRKYHITGLHVLNLKQAFSELPIR